MQKLYGNIIRTTVINPSVCRIYGGREGEREGCAAVGVFFTLRVVIASNS